MWLQTRRERVGSEVGKSCPIFFLPKTPKFFRDDLRKLSSSMTEWLYNLLVKLQTLLIIARWADESWWAVVIMSGIIDH